MCVLFKNDIIIYYNPDNTLVMIMVEMFPNFELWLMNILRISIHREVDDDKVSLIFLRGH